MSASPRGMSSFDIDAPAHPFPASVPTTRIPSSTRQRNEDGALCGLQNPCGNAKVGGAVSLFPGETRPVASEVAVASGLKVNGTAQIQVLDDLGRLEGEDFANDP